MKRSRILTALIIGCGSIARRRAANLKKLGIKRVFVFDPDPSRVEYMRRELGCEPVDSVQAGLDAHPGVVLICTPPAAHVNPALAAIARKIPCFIEKPVANTFAASERIRYAAAKHSSLVVVGYQLRFHPAIIWIRRGLDKGRWGPLQYIRAQVGQYLPDWRPWQDYKESYTARRSLGGGILLDASHEIDLSLYLAGRVQSVFCAADHLSTLEIDVEDTAELIFRFHSGVMGSVHLDMIRRSYDRSCHLLCRDGVVEWSYQDGTVREYRAASKKWTTRSFTKDGNEMYLAEMKTFLAAANGIRAIGSAGPNEGSATLRIVEAAKRSARSGRSQPLPMKIVAIVQARMGSTRLPGKVLKPLAGKPMLWHVLRRTLAAKRISEVILATTTAPADRALEPVARELGVRTVFGHPTDVLDRYYQTASAAKADVIVRVTADCPFIDPEVLDACVELFHRSGAVYASNAIKRTFPNGLDVEVFTFSALEVAWKEAVLASEREHVTPFLWKNPNRFPAAELLQETDLSALRWCVDNPEDLVLAQTVCDELGRDGRQFGYPELLQFIQRRPDLTALNAGISDNEGYDKSIKEDRIIDTGVGHGYHAEDQSR